MSDSNATTRKCLQCGCTNQHPCKGGCTWVSETLDVCDRCFPAAALVAVKDAQENFRKVTIDAPHCVLFVLSQLCQTMFVAGLEAGNEPTPELLNAIAFVKRLQAVLAKNDPVLKFILDQGWPEVTADGNAPTILTPDRRIIVP